MENIDIMVDFKYCDSCKHRDLEEKYDPCHECLMNPVNTQSEKPVKYEEKED